MQVADVTTAMVEKLGENHWAGKFVKSEGKFGVRKTAGVHPVSGAAAEADNGSCEYFGCTDQNASNYFCIANPDVCGGSQGGTVDPTIGTVTDNETCEYNHCADIQAVKCGNPYDQPGQRTQNVRRPDG